MFFGLRHPAVICRHNQKREIDRACPADHLPNEILVPGNINHSDRKHF